VRAPQVKLRPTPFGLTMMVAVGAISGARAGATDPNIAAMVWVGLVAMVVIGWGWPLLVVGTARAELVEAPTDAHVATAVPIRITLSGRGPGGAVEVRWADSPQWHAAQLAQGGSLTLIPAERGIAERLRLELASSAPLEMVRVIRTVELELARPLYIAPVPVAEERPAALLTESGATPRSTAATGAGDVVRSVRPYRPGDAAQLVHWPSSARSGSLVVRELEPPTRPGLVLVVELRSRSALVEEAVAGAAGIAESMLRRGGQVLLCTHERGGPVSGEITSSLQLGRRLAAATIGAPGPPPVAPDASWSVVRIAP